MLNATNVIPLRTICKYCLGVIDIENKRIVQCQCHDCGTIWFVMDGKLVTPASAQQILEWDDYNHLVNTLKY